MAEDWRELHEFVNGEVMLASYFEDMRQDYLYLREPRYAVERGKAASNEPKAIAYSGSTFNLVALGASIIDPVYIEASGRDLVVWANPTAIPPSTSDSLGFSLAMDGVLLYGSGQNGLQRIGANDVSMRAMNMLWLVHAPTPGEHYFEIYWCGAGAVAGNIMMVQGNNLMCGVMEL